MVYGGNLACAQFASPKVRTKISPKTAAKRLAQVASMLGESLDSKEIAQGLRIGPASVKNHIHNILEKSQLPSRSAIGARLDQRHMRVSA
ncbi:LuxR C-terminal-related transcriptional regulator [Croceibacterium salegens]|uniref:LuxR C-terminal-related transcriptional regulator n=1 Tax=Croceibacterium salegens TaxID=1737568 RepID=UPI0038B24A7A